MLSKRALDAALWVAALLLCLLGLVAAVVEPPLPRAAWVAAVTLGLLLVMFALSRR